MLGFIVSSCHPTNYEPYFQKAERLFVAGDYKEAVGMYLQAIQEKSGRAETFFGLATSYERLRDFEGAMYAFERAIELDPKNPAAYEHLGSVYLDLGHPDRYNNALSEGHCIGWRVRRGREYTGARVF